MTNPNRVNRASTEPQSTGRRAATSATSAESPLRWTCKNFEFLQRRRVAIGEQLRAVLQERDTGWPLDHPIIGEPDDIIRDVAFGRSTGPVRVLGEAYRRAWTDEKEAIEVMAGLLAQHPVWPWLGHIKGAGPSVCGRLLSRLDITKASRPSSFWAFCGLHTVPGVRYECAECGAVLVYLANQRAMSHHRPGTEIVCTHALTRGDVSEKVRVAPRPLRGHSLDYDSNARVACYLLSLSFSRQGDSYKAVYRRQRERLAARAEWTPQHQHLTALRITSKLFLVHLWFVWREATGLPVAVEDAMLAGEPVQNPWEMVDKPRGPVSDGTRPPNLGAPDDRTAG
jgi:hypothetical protein